MGIASGRFFFRAFLFLYWKNSGQRRFYLLAATARATGDGLQQHAHKHTEERKTGMHSRCKQEDEWTNERRESDRKKERKRKRKVRCFAFACVWCKGGAGNNVRESKQMLFGQFQWRSRAKARSQKSREGLDARLTSPRLAWCQCQTRTTNIYKSLYVHHFQQVAPHPTPSPLKKRPIPMQRVDGKTIFESQWIERQIQRHFNV